MALKGVLQPRCGQSHPSREERNHRDLEYSFMSIGQCADTSEAEACVRWNSGMPCSHIRQAVCM